jgi:polyhydroxyalkanoate synthesis regulator phasin
MRDALRSYLQIATGLTEMTVQRVTEAAKQLVEKTGVDLDGVPAQVAQQAQTVPQYVQQIADDLFTTGKANRDLLVGVVRGEVEKAMARLRPWADDVRRVEDEVARLEHRVTDLEHRLAQASAPRRPSRPQPVVVDVRMRSRCRCVRRVRGRRRRPSRRRRLRGGR